MEGIDNLIAARGIQLADWVTVPATANEIKNRFKKFLCTYTDAKGSLIFKERIRRMVECKVTTIYVSPQQMLECT